MFSKDKSDNKFNHAFGILPGYAGQFRFHDEDNMVTELFKYISRDFEWYISYCSSNPFPLFFPHSPAIKGSLSHLQTQNLIHQIDKKFGPINYLEIEELDAIVIQTEFGNFALRYGHERVAGCYVLPFYFHTEKGFTPVPEVRHPSQDEEYVQKIINKLQETWFPKWRTSQEKPKETLFSQNRFLLFTAGAIAISIPVIAAATNCFNSPGK